MSAPAIAEQCKAGAGDDRRGNPYLLEVTERMLAGFGCEVEGLASGEAALARCRDKSASPIDVALIDVDLPGVDGVKVAAALKDASTASSIVMLSPGGRDGRPQSWASAGIDRWLSKPLKQSQLFDTMMELLGTVPAPSSATPRTLAGRIRRCQGLTR